MEVTHPLLRQPSIARVAASYLLLVGLPLLTVPMIFKVGRQLSAPPAIGGEWTFRLGSSRSSAGCPWQGIKQIDANITQAGRDVRITFKAGSRLVLVGWLREAGMKGYGLAAGGPTVTGSPIIERLTAMVQARDLDRTMEGSLSFAAAAGCETPFSAARSFSSQQSAQ